MRQFWSVFLKSFVGGGALFFAGLFDFSFWASVAFFLVLCRLFFSLNNERKGLFASFWIFGIMSFFFASALSSFLLSLALFVLLFLIFGIDEFLFREHAFFRDFTHVLSAFFLFFASFFIGNNWSFSLVVCLFIAFFALFYQAFGSIFLFKKGILFALSFAFSFIFLQISWIVAFLPLGFLYAGLLLTTLFVLLKDTLEVYFGGALNRRFLVKDLTFFVLFTLILFVLSFSSI